MVALLRRALSCPDTGCLDHHSQQSNDKARANGEGPALYLCITSLDHPPQLPGGSLQQMPVTETRQTRWIDD